jgi:hypothetical protein
MMCPNCGFQHDGESHVVKKVVRDISDPKHPITFIGKFCAMCGIGYLGVKSMSVPILRHKRC